MAFAGMSNMKRNLRQPQGSPKRQKVRRQTAKLPSGAVPLRAHKEELKNFDVALGTAGIGFGSTAAGVECINFPVAGTAPTQHVGREIMMKSLFIRWHGTVAPTTTGAASLRMLVVYDKQTNTALPATTQIVVTDEISTMMNLNNNKRFTVLMDEIVSCVGTAGPQAWNVHRYIKMNHPVEFNQTNGGTVADIQTGGVYVLTWQSGGLLIASPVGQLYSRIRFSDV